VKDRIRPSIEPGLRRFVLGMLAALMVVLGASAASAQTRRGPLVVLGLRAPDGEDDIANTATNALRSAARAEGFEVPSDSPSLEQSIAAFGCDDSLPLDCLGQIAADLHAPRMVYGSVRRMGRGRNAEIRIEVLTYEQASRTTGGPAQVQLARALAQDGDALRAPSRRMLEELLPPPPPAPPPPAETVVTPVVPVTPAAPPVPVRRYIGYGAVGVGAALVATGTAFGVMWLGLSGDAQREDSPWSRYQPFAPDARETRDGEEICKAARARLPNYMNTGPTPQLSEVVDICNRHSSYQTLQWGLLAAGAAVAVAGVVLILTDPPASAPADGERHATRRPPSFEFSPVLSPSYQGASFQLRF
jgi:hypothetical protein